MIRIIKNNHTTINTVIDYMNNNVNWLNINFGLFVVYRIIIIITIRIAWIEINRFEWKVYLLIYHSSKISEWIELIFFILFLHQIYRISKLFLLIIALKCITLQWKIINLIIYLIFFGFFQLSILFDNRDHLYKYQKYLTDSIRQYERLSLYDENNNNDNHSYQIKKFWQTFIIKCNMGFFWLIYFTNVITYILLWLCFVNYMSNTMPEFMNQFMEW